MWVVAPAQAVCWEVHPGGLTCGVEVGRGLWQAGDDEASGAADLLAG
jgi:hypothetical protein